MDVSRGGGGNLKILISVGWEAQQLQLQFCFEYDFNLLYNYQIIINSSFYLVIL